MTEMMCLPFQYLIMLNSYSVETMSSVAKPVSCPKLRTLRSVAP